jgi:hypothetical protein
MGERVMNGTQLTTEQTFQQAIKDRLREDMGTLMPDEALAAMAEKAIQEMFFTRKEDKGYHSQPEPSWFEAECAKLMRAKITATMSNYFAKNEDVLQGAVMMAIEKSMPAMLAEVITSALSGAGATIGCNLGLTVANAVDQSMQR